MCKRNINQLPLTYLQLGTWPTTQVCALTGNWTANLSVHRPALNPLSHTRQGKKLFKKRYSSCSWSFPDVASQCIHYNIWLLLWIFVIIDYFCLFWNFIEMESIILYVLFYVCLISLNKTAFIHESASSKWNRPCCCMYQWFVPFIAM